MWRIAAVAVFLALCIGALSARAQFDAPIYVGASAGGSPAGPFVLKNHATLTGNATQTADIDCAGTNVLIVGVARFPSGANAAPADTGGNTYTQFGTEATNGTSNVALWYSIGAPSVSASFHWGNTLGSQFIALAGACFSDGSTSSADQTNQADNANQAGIVTPSVANELVISAYVPPNGGSGTPSISAGFTTIGVSAVVGGTTVGGGLAYQIQTAATGVNPTWSTSGGGTGGTLSRTFK